MSDLTLPLARWRAVRDRIRRATGRDDAEDLLQSAAVRLLEPGRGDIRNPEAYLVTAARNLGWDTGRQEQREANAPLGLSTADMACPQPSPFDVYESRRRLEHLEAGCRMLPERTRSIFLLHRLDGLSYSDIAKRLGVSVSAVEKHISHALSYLSDWMLD